MAIDIQHEHLLTLREALAYLREHGVRIGTSALYGWVRSGRLESVKLSYRMTSVEAIQRMAEGTRSPTAGQKARTKAQIEKEGRAAMERLRLKGLKV